MAWGLTPAPQAPPRHLAALGAQCEGPRPPPGAGCQLGCRTTSMPATGDSRGKAGYRALLDISRGTVLTLVNLGVGQHWTPR